MTRLRWTPILDRAVAIVAARDTMMTIRQIFYRLVAETLIPNRLPAYNRLCRLSAQWRREGRFPRLLDQGREISRPASFTGPDDARGWLHDVYRRDRTEGQPWSVYVAAEKATLLAQLDDWFADRGIPVLTLRGYSGQELVTDVQNDIMVSNRPAVLLYAGDLDPSGQDIDRDFARRVGIFDTIVRVGLNDMDQVERFGLPPMLGKANDPRAADFVAKHGQLVQVELEALDPDDLRALYEGALAPHWDNDAYQAVLAQEDEDRARLGGTP
jgi:hypothetical protein